jgi:hypothetical protein
MREISAGYLKLYLGDFRYNLTDEYTIQAGIERVLRDAELDFEREKHLAIRDRLDFFVGGVAIEVKRQGSVGDLLRQLSRYAEYGVVRELLVVTARAQLSDLPSELGGKPLECLVLLRSIFV